MRAKVELKGALSYRRGGKVWKKKVPQIVTNQSDVDFYKTNSLFNVTMLQDPPKAKAAAPKPSASAGK